VAFLNKTRAPAATVFSEHITIFCSSKIKINRFEEEKPNLIIPTDPRFSPGKKNSHTRHRSLLTAVGCTCTKGHHFYQNNIILLIVVRKATSLISIIIIIIIIYFRVSFKSLTFFRHANRHNTYIEH